LGGFKTHFIKLNQELGTGEEEGWGKNYQQEVTGVPPIISWKGVNN